MVIIVQSVVSSDALLIPLIRNEMKCGISKASELTTPNEVLSTSQNSK